jgi:hypothetical protein
MIFEAGSSRSRATWKQFKFLARIKLACKRKGTSSIAINVM